MVQKETDKLRTKVEHRCSSNHVLSHLISNKIKIVKQCAECNQESLLRYFCSECPIPKFYCYKCRPMSLKDGCLFLHTLIPYKFEEGE